MSTGGAKPPTSTKINYSLNKQKTMQTTIKDLKVGDFFTLKDYGENEVKESVVWVRGEYDRASKTYSCCKFNHMCHEHFFKGAKVVFTDFIF